MNQYRVQVSRFMDESTLSGNSIYWYWVGDYYLDPDRATQVALMYRKVYANVRIVHRGEVWKTLD